MVKRIKIAILEDNETIGLIFGEVVIHMIPSAEVHYFKSPRECLESLINFDLFISDYDFGDIEGNLSKFKDKFDFDKLILITGTKNVYDFSPIVVIAKTDQDSLLILRNILLQKFLI